MILVTGGSGMSGSFIVRALQQRGHAVRVLARPASAPAVIALGAEHAVGDLEDLDSVRRAAAGVDGIVHVACTFSLEPAVDIAATAALVEAWDRGPLVFISTVDVYGFPRALPVDESHPREGTFWGYGEGKIRCEEQIEAEAARRGRTDFSILRPPHIWGPHPRCSERLRKTRVQNGEPIVLAGATEEEWSLCCDAWVDARELAWATAECVGRPLGGAANVITGSFTWHEFYTTIIRLTGSASRIVHKAVAEITEDELPNKALYSHTWRYSVALLEQRLGFRPTHDLPATIAETLALPAPAARRVTSAPAEPLSQTGRTAVRELERAYDELLSEKLSVVNEYVADQRALLGRHEIDTADFHLPLRPMFYTREDLARIEGGARALWGGLLDVYRHVFGSDPEKAADFLETPRAFVPWLARCFQPEREVDELFGRPDGFVWDDQVRFIEQNTTSGAGGMASTEALVEFFDGFPALAALRAHCPVEKLSLADAYADYFRSEHRGTTVGYMDAFEPDTGERWDEQGVLFLERLKERGVDLRYLEYGKVSFQDDGVSYRGEPIHCFYRGMAAVGMVSVLDLVTPYFEACGRGVARMISTPYEIVFFDKLLLPYLSDDDLNSFLSAERRAAVTAVLPWTRFVRDYDTWFHDRRVHVPSFCVAEKDSLILKKGDGCCSNAVMVGAETAPGPWQEQVARNVREGGWIVQEMVNPPQEALPFLDGEALIRQEVTSMTCPYLVRGRVAAIGGRTSVPGGSRVLVGAGVKGFHAGIRTAFCVG